MHRRWSLGYRCGRASKHTPNGNVCGQHTALDGAGGRREAGEGRAGEAVCRRGQDADSRSCRAPGSARSKRTMELQAASWMDGSLMKCPSRLRRNDPDASRNLRRSDTVFWHPYDFDVFICRRCQSYRLHSGGHFIQLTANASVAISLRRSKSARVWVVPTRDEAETSFSRGGSVSDHATILGKTR